jgi:hypothetical protein
MDRNQILAARVLQEPFAKEETLLHNQRTLDRLQTSNTVRESITGEEHATYVVNRDKSSDQLVVDILPRPRKTGRPPSGGRPVRCTTT